MGRFKKKKNRCRSCGTKFLSHEEKETDVNIGAHLMADALQDRFDRALVVSADTDLNGVVEFTRNEARSKLIQIVAPPGRKNNNRKALFAIAKGKVAQSLLPEQCEHGGTTIERPVEYLPPTT